MADVDASFEPRVDPADPADPADEPARPDRPTPFTPSAFAFLLWPFLLIGGAVIVVAMQGFASSGMIGKPGALVAVVALVIFGELRPVITSR